MAGESSARGALRAPPESMLDMLDEKFALVAPFVDRFAPFLIFMPGIGRHMASAVFLRKTLVMLLKHHFQGAYSSLEPTTSSSAPATRPSQAPDGVHLNKSATVYILFALFAVSWITKHVLGASLSVVNATLLNWLLTLLVMTQPQIAHLFIVRSGNNARDVQAELAQMHGVIMGKLQHFFEYDSIEGTLNHLIDGFTNSYKELYALVSQR